MQRGTQRRREENCEGNGTVARVPARDTVHSRGLLYRPVGKSPFASRSFLCSNPQSPSYSRRDFSSGCTASHRISSPLHPLLLISFSHDRQLYNYISVYCWHFCIELLRDELLRDRTEGARKLPIVTITNYISWHWRERLEINLIFTRDLGIIYTGKKKNGMWPMRPYIFIQILIIRILNLFLINCLFLDLWFVPYN